MQKKEHVAVRLDPWLIKWLEEESKRRGWAFSKTVRRILKNAYLDKTAIEVK